MADYTVGISSSFVKKKFKIKGDSGKGESTIYMGPGLKRWNLILILIFQDLQLIN